MARDQLLSRYPSLFRARHLTVRHATQYILYYTSMLVARWPRRARNTRLRIYRGISQPVGARHTSCMQLLWKPHDPSREDTRIYLVTFETSWLVGASNTSCKQLLWKPRDPSREGTHIHLVTFETSRPVVTRNTSCTQLLCKPCDPSKGGPPIYLVTFETSRPMWKGTVHVSSYCGNPAIRAGKANPFT
jgi:hypothetical protein